MASLPDPPEQPDPPGGAEPVRLDLDDFDAVGLMVDVVVALRRHALEASVDATATVSAPDGWHRVALTARQSGHVVLGIRYTALTPSRRHNVARALARREWQLDEDGDGATRRFPPGTDASTPAFEVLAVVPMAGAPSDVRELRAVDVTGAPVPLT